MLTSSERFARLAQATLLLTLGACDTAGPASHDATPAPGGSADKADIWVFDTRLEWFELGRLPEIDPIYDADGAFVAASSVAAVARSNRVEQWDELTYTAVETMGACPDERFADQPAQRSSGTAVLIDDDLVLTAWHVARTIPCDDLRFVFGYRRETEGDPIQTVARLDPGEDVYACAEIVLPATFDQGQSDYADGIDLALVRLDRPVSQAYTPAEIAPAPWLVDRPAAMLSMGMPVGMPLKVDPGFVLNVDASNYFEVGSDLFKGTSGGPLFDADNRLIGIVKGGPRDFERRDGESCVRYTSHVAKLNRASWAQPILRQYCDEVDDGGPWCTELRDR